MPTKQTTLPLDDPDLTNDQALFAAVRAMHDDLQLIKARLDGITEALSGLSADVRAMTATPQPPPVQTTQPTQPPQTMTGVARAYALMSVDTKVIPKHGGGSWTKQVAKFYVDGKYYERDIPRGKEDWFAQRVGQVVNFTEAKNDKGFWNIVAVGA